MYKKQNNPKTFKNEKFKDARNLTLMHLSALCACFFKDTSPYSVFCIWV